MIVFFGTRVLKAASGWFATGVMAGGFGCSLYALTLWLGHRPDTICEVLPWIPLPGNEPGWLYLGAMIDGLTIAMMVKHALDNGYKTIEVTKEAEDTWVDLLMTGPGMMLGSPDCTPGYYNNEGKSSERGAQNGFYGGGSIEFFKILEDWRAEGSLEGMELS